MLGRPLLVSEARGRSLMRRERRVVVMMVGLVRRRWGVAVVVVRRVVGRGLLHTRVSGLVAGRSQRVTHPAITETGQQQTPTRVCQGAGGPTLW